MQPDKLPHHMEQTAAVGGQTATCVLQYGQSYPPLRVRIYYKTNNRKLCWLRCENSNNPHPCVSFLPLCCWLDFTTSSSLVSPQSDVAWGGLTVTRAAGYCIPSHCDWGIVCLSTFCTHLETMSWEGTCWKGSVCVSSSYQHRAFSGGLTWFCFKADLQTRRPQSTTVGTKSDSPLFVF